MAIVNKKLLEQSNLIDNYIYIYHLHTDKADEGTWCLIPVYPESLTDSLQSSFSSQNALSRTAPVYSYSYSGPRTVQFTFNLHRDLMDDMNYNRSNMKVAIGDDYVDTLIKNLQSIALPNYNAKGKEVEPPMVAVRIGEELFIKGVVASGITVSYGKPILSNNKYAQVSISFTVSEIDPIDANTVAQYGSFRYLTKTFKDGIYKV